MVKNYTNVLGLKIPSIALLAISLIAVAGIAYLFFPAAFQDVGLAAQGGTILSLNQIDYSTSTDSSIPFSKIYSANIVFNGGGQYLSGTQKVQSDPITLKDTDGSSVAKVPITVGFQLVKSYSKYSLQSTPQSINWYKIDQYFPSNSINLADNNGFGYACKAGMQVIFKNPYEQKKVGANFDGSPIYANVFSRQDCADDFSRTCTNLGQGYTVINADNLVQGFLNSYSELGRACIKLSPQSHMQVFKPIDKTNGFQATVTVTKGGSAPATETLNIDEAHTIVTTTNVQVRFTEFGGSLNAETKQPGDFYVVRLASSQSGVASSSAIDSAMTLGKDMPNKALGTNSLSGLISTVTNYNTGLASITLDYTSINLANVVSTETSASGYALQDVSNAPAQYPNGLAYVNADWVGVSEPVALPVLGDVTPNPVIATGGQAAYATFSVSNGASNQGAINVPVPVCTPPLSVSYTADPNRNYAPNGQFTAGLKIMGQSNQQSTCTITATSTAFTNPPPTPVTKIFTVNVAQACTVTCTGNSYLKPTSSAPCACFCPVSASVCQASGLGFDETNCLCTPKPPPPKCGELGQPPCPPTQCVDGTAIGICSKTPGMICDANGELSAATACNKVCATYEFLNATNACVPCAPPLVWNTTSLTCAGGAPPPPPPQLEWILGAIVAILAIGGLVYVGKKEKWF